MLYIRKKEIVMANETIERKIFLKGELYTTGQEGLVVMCIKTTCNYSTRHFKGVVIESQKYPIGAYSKTWLTLTFKEYKK